MFCHFFLFLRLLFRVTEEDVLLHTKSTRTQFYIGPFCIARLCIWGFPTKSCVVTAITLVSYRKAIGVLKIGPTVCRRGEGLIIPKQKVHYAMQNSAFTTSKSPRKHSIVELGPWALLLRGHESDADKLAPLCTPSCPIYTGMLRGAREGGSED